LASFLSDEISFLLPPFVIICITCS